ncbi:MAG: TGS domain-containing protein [Candidatus Marinimicrobia bacterium]|nr:TGS domain-containing protein [Candidatus Neomarinimicrobiota bacterium]
MPANLPPDYFAAEERFRSAESISAKIHCLEEMISRVPKHKGTDHLRAELRRKLSRLKSEQHKKGSVGRHESEYHIEREGAGRIVIIGPTNVGKSALVGTLSHATPKVSDSPYTSWGPTPGMVNFHDIHLQMIDTPPLSAESSKPELFDLVKTADMAVLMLDIRGLTIQQFENSVELLGNHRIVPDFLENDSGKSIPIPTLIAINKIDNKQLLEDFQTFCEIESKDWPIIPLSVKNRLYFDLLSQRCIEIMQLIRIYSKPPGKDADLSQPYVLKTGSTVEDFAGKVHRDFLKNLKTARVWGKHVFNGQRVARDHVLEDGDIVELHI